MLAPTHMIQPSVLLPLISGIALPGILGCSGKSPQAREAPKLRVTPPVLDLGFVSQEDALFGEFRIENISSDPLSIELGAPSCACTHAVLEADRLGPGESTELAVTIRTSGHLGAVEGTIPISYQGRTLELRVIAVVEEGLVVLPSQIVVPSISKCRSDVAHANFEIRCSSANGEEAIAEFRAKSPWDFLMVSLGSAGQQRQLEGGVVSMRYLGTLVIDPQRAPVGKHLGWIEIAGRRGNRAVDFRLPVVASVTPRLMVRPDTIAFGTLSYDDVRERLVSIQSDCLEVSVSGVHVAGASAAALNWKWEQESPNCGQIRFALQPEAETPPGWLTWSINVHIDGIPEPCAVTGVALLVANETDATSDGTLAGSPNSGPAYNDGSNRPRSP